jgi:predicted DNA-binding transcriptional regulator AlpA
MNHYRSVILPVSCPPRGLSRVESAAYVGVSPSLFDEMVKDGRMPHPKLINSRTVWDRHELDGAFEALPSKENMDITVPPANEWDSMK